ncbi:MAG: ATP-binding protein [Prevotella sp.]|nr:ATP-binding protein [Prevotella sp.]
MIIGRTEEQQELRRAYESEYSEFVAVYGRRRVGKTFLVRETFGYQFTFTHTGLAKKNTKAQLANFQTSLRSQGMPKAPMPENWLQAFVLLEELLQKSTDKKKVVFIDELPWMDAPRSSFLMALEHFWNGFASARKDILLIVCGSATSWIINKIVKNHGGLHNRITYSIPLQPFTLNECEQYAKSLKLEMNRRQIVECYMIMGGVPFYWSKLKRGKSLAQNIDDLFFAKTGGLRDEFSQLYASLFLRPERYIKVVEVLGTKKVGMTRTEIVSSGKAVSNGKLTSVLEDLEYCGFIRKYYSIGKKTKDAIYQLIDNYTLFYYKYIAGNTINDEHFWSKNLGAPLYNAWSGLAFERVCLLHSRQIKDKLGISGVITSEYSWRTDKTDEHPGVQIDLLIDRSDDTITICEMKFTREPFAISHDYDEKLQMRKAIFRSETGTTKALHIALVSYAGLVRNAYSDDIQNQVTADDLFKDIPT